MKYGLILAMVLATGVMAQTVTNAPPLSVPGGAPAAAPATPVVTPATPDVIITTNEAAMKPVKKTVKRKKKPAKPAAVIPPAPPLAVNEPAVAKQNNVNVRAQAHINSEVVARLKRGDTVMVLEEVTLKHPKVDEPAKWARIALPADAHAWVNSAFIDGTNQMVQPAKLNVRSGAGENYSVIGLLHKGDSVKTMSTKGDWTEIEAPTNAYAFVAAHLLAPKPASTEPVTPAPLPITSIVDNSTPMAPPPSAPPTTPADTTASTPVPVVTPVIPVPLPAPADEPPPKRIVQREGIVGGTVSIQAPTHYELESLDNGNVIDYLYTTSTNVVMKRYKGRTVLVTGEEELDERWPNTPVITIQKIQVVE